MSEYLLKTRTFVLIINSIGGLFMAQMDDIFKSREPILKKYKQNVSKLKLSNNIKNPDLIKGGHKLRVK